MVKTTSCVVYWLYDERCVCPWRHGYIGISSNHQRRIAVHRRTRSFQKFSVQILFVGSPAECRMLEYKLRPQRHIGWNHGAGGGKGRLGFSDQKLKGRIITWADKIAATLTGHVRTDESRAKQSAKMKGRPKTLEQRAKMRVAALKRYTDPAERERTSRVVKDALKIDRRRKRGWAKRTIWPGQLSLFD